MRTRSQNQSFSSKDSLLKSLLTISFSTLCVCIIYTSNIARTEAITLNITDISPTFKFTKDLKLGDSTSPDISYLQFVLNQTGDTQVATSGPGSPDELTNYFGSKTQASVRNFQEKFRADILTPAGINTPTGVVGGRTRAKLNEILSSLFDGTYVDKYSETPSSNDLAVLAGTNKTKAFTSSVAKTLGTTRTSSSSANAPIISSFSTFKALSGQLMSLFGVHFHATKNTIYLGSENIGTYPSSDNGTKITFKVPSTLETGSYEVGLANTFGTTSTGFIHLDVIKQTVSTSTPEIKFEPSLITVYPNTSKNMNDLIFLYGENFSFNNTLETNLGNTIVRSTDRKTLSFLISELPYYMEAFRKYRGQSINVLMKIRNENGLSKEQLVHVIQFPDSSIPTVNTGNGGAIAAGGAAVSIGVASGDGSTVGGANSTTGGASVTDFGGQIIQSTVCTCSEGLPTYLKIKDIRGSVIDLLYRPGASSLKENYNIWTPSVNTLGGMTPGGGACLVGVEPYCSSVGTAQYTVDFIRGIGTSVQGGI